MGLAYHLHISASCRWPHRSPPEQAQAPPPQATEPWRPMVPPPRRDPPSETACRRFSDPTQRRPAQPESPSGSRAQPLSKRAVDSSLFPIRQHCRRGETSRRLSHRRRCRQTPRECKPALPSITLGPRRFRPPRLAKRTQRLRMSNVHRPQPARSRQPTSIFPPPRLSIPPACLSLRQPQKNPPRTGRQTHPSRRAASTQPISAHGPMPSLSNRHPILLRICSNHRRRSPSVPLPPSRLPILRRGSWPLSRPLQPPGPRPISPRTPPRRMRKTRSPPPTPRFPRNASKPRPPAVPPNPSLAPRP